MPRVRSYQSSFNAGVLDPRLASRLDLRRFYNGLETGDNILIQPQGGLVRRPGMAYVDTAAGNGRLGSFAFNTEQTYLLVFTDLNVAIYRDGVKQADVTTPWTLADLPELRWTQSADTMILVHEDYQPRKLVRAGSHTAWTLSTISLTNIPAYAFGLNYPGVSVTPAATTGTGVTMTASGDWFAAGDVGATIIGNGGTCTIASYVSPTQVTVNISTAFNDTNAIPAGSWSFDMDTATTTTEDIWSARRGWPRSVTFYEGRLWFGGSKSKPQSIFGSNVDDFFNFDLGTGLDDEGIFVTIDTDQVNAINAIFAGRHLQIFTSGGEFYVPQDVIRPSDIAVKRQSLYGSSTVAPVSIDGATLFIERSGKALRDFVYSFAEAAYVAQESSLMAPHLINAPVDLAALKGTSTNNANYVYVVNSDGTVAVHNTLRAQEVTAWSRWVTSGSIKSVTVVLDDVYFLVQRTINSATVYYIEKADENTYTDANKRQTQASSVTVTGLSHLDGELCRVRADGSVMTDKTPSGGQITLERASVDVEVGLNFDPTVKTMPLNVGFQDGPILVEKKRLVSATVDLYEAQGVKVNGTLIPSRQLGTGVLGTPPASLTGPRRVRLMGYDRRAQVTLSQSDPVPMVVRGLSLEVEA